MDTIADFGAEEAAMQAYFRDGEVKAAALDNRGPLRFTADGQLDPAIIAAYKRVGFYIFEGVFAGAELAALQTDVHNTLDRLPADPDAKVDHKGRPAIAVDNARQPIVWSKPLGDPFGGTDFASNRAPVKMIEPEAAPDRPKQVPLVLGGTLQYSDAVLRVYGHPDLLAMVAALNGDDFVPYSDVIVIKQPGEGGSFAWHQDGTTHWNSPKWHQDIHGVNVMVQLYDCTAANGLWYVPGSHAVGKLDIKQMVADAGSNRLPQAVPAICKAGDVAISNRQILHGSFPNTGKSWRVSVISGFHRRDAVVGVTTIDAFGNTVTYDDERVRKRSELIGYAIAARRQRFPAEKSYAYRPQAESGERYEWNEAARAAIKHYQARDLYL